MKHTYMYNAKFARRITELSRVRGQQWGLRTIGERWERHCGDKKRHINRASAEEERLRLERIEHDRFNSYHCEACGGWHVGHKSGGSQNA